MSNPYDPNQPNQPVNPNNPAHLPSGHFPQQAGAYASYSTPPLGADPNNPQGDPGYAPQNPGPPQGQNPGYAPQGQNPGYAPQGQNVSSPTGQNPGYAPQGQYNPPTQVAQPAYQPPPEYQAPPAHYQQGGGARIDVKIPEFINPTLEIAKKPTDPPVPSFANRGNFVMALAWVAIAALVGGLIGGVLSGALGGIFGRWFGYQLLSSALGWSAAFAAATMLLAQRMGMDVRKRDDTASALAPGWAAIVVGSAVLGGLFSAITPGLASAVIIVTFLALLGYGVRVLRVNSSLSADSSLVPLIWSLGAAALAYSMMNTIMYAIFF